MKLYTSVLLGLFVLTVTGVAVAESSEAPVLVCRGHQCADASFSMTQGFLLNRLNQLMDKNVGKTVLVCEADPFSHICLQEGLTFSADAAFSPVQITVKDFRLIDKKMGVKPSTLDIALDYRIQANQTFPDCQVPVSHLTVEDTDRVELLTPDFSCRLIQTGATAFNASYRIDYLDFDYGLIGAHYTLAAGETLRGDRTGYALFRFTAKPDLVRNESSDDSVVSQPAESEKIPEIIKETAPEDSNADGATVVEAEVTVDPEQAEAPAESEKETPVATVSEQSDTLIIAPETESAPTLPAPEPEPTVTETVIRLVPDKSAEPQTIAVPVQIQKPAVIRTTTVERTIITPDGTRQSEPPEIRTFVDGLEVVAP